MPVKKASSPNGIGVQRTKQKQKQKQNVKVSQNVKVVVADVKKKRVARKPSSQQKSKPATNISLNIVNPYNVPNVMNPSNYLQYQAQEAKEVRENHQKIYDNLLRQQENRPVEYQRPQQQYYTPTRVNWGNVFKSEPRAEVAYANFAEDFNSFDGNSFYSARTARDSKAQQLQYEQQLQQEEDRNSNPLSIPGSSLTLQNAFQNLYQGSLESSMDDEETSIEIPPPAFLTQDNEAQTSFRDTKDQDAQTSFSPEDYQAAMANQAGAGAEDKTPKRSRGRPQGRMSNLQTPQEAENYQDIYQKLGQYTDHELRKKQLTGDRLYQYAQQLGLAIKDPVTKKKVGARELKETVIDLININRRYPPKADLPPSSPAPPPQTQPQPSSKKKNKKKKKIVLTE